MGDLLRHLRASTSAQVDVIHDATTGKLLVTMVSHDDKTAPIRRTMVEYDDSLTTDEIMKPVMAFLTGWINDSERTGHHRASVAASRSGGRIWR